METDPKVLLVLLTYKSNLAWLTEAMYSIKAQSSQSFTCVVADSTPDLELAATIKGLAEGQGDGFVYQHYPHQATADVAYKVNASVNLHAKEHKYIVVMSDDDVLHPFFLEKQMLKLEEDSSRAFCQFHVIIFGGVFQGWDIRPNLKMMDQVRANQFAGTCLMRLDAFRAFGGYDADVCPEGHPCGIEDYNLFVHYLRCAWTYGFVAEPLLFARDHGTQNNKKVYGTRKFMDCFEILLNKQGFVYTMDKDKMQVNVTKAPCLERVDG